MATSTSDSAPEKQFEMILLGEAGVGKTSLFLYFKNNRFVEEECRTTVGVDQMLKTVEIDGEEVKIKVHDTGGSEKFRSVTSGFYRRANIALAVYSVNDLFTLDTLSDWIKECKDNNLSPDDLMLVLVGNKCDLQNEVDQDKVEAFCSHDNNSGIRQRYIVSAKEGTNVNEMFERIVNSFYRNGGKEINSYVPPEDDIVTIEEKQSDGKQKKKSCC